jgi:predicted deacylase
VRGQLLLAGVARRIPRLCLRMAAALALLAAAGGADAAQAPRERQHLIFWKGSAQELEVFKIYGREAGPTVMLLGGIQGDEPGGFLSADPYADISLKKGNLIVVPRANFRSVVFNNRGPAGDMNRKFEDGLPYEPELDVVAVLKSLMAESDLLLNLHDGSGFYRPVWESDMANPKRYGQSIIADTDAYVHAASGRTVELAKAAEEVVARLNREIAEPLYRYHFFNMETVKEDTQYPEQRKSATYYALTRLGIPAFGIEASKQLPSLEMKIRHHILAINAFLDIYGVELEQPGISLARPTLGYVLIAVNDSFPIAVAAGQTLTLSPGDRLEVLHISASCERGLSVEVQGFGGLNDIERPVTIEAPTDILVRRDSTLLGRIHVALLPEKDKGRSPLLSGAGRALPPKSATPATLAMLPGTAAMAGIQAAGTERAGADILAFLVEVDGKAAEIPPGGRIDVARGARVKLVDITMSGAGRRQGVVMNLRGFVPEALKEHNTGEDRGHTADTARDLLPAFSEGRKGEVYAINAEIGKKVLASCTLRLTDPAKPAARKPEAAATKAGVPAVTLRYMDKTRYLPLGSRIAIPAGTRVELLELSLPESVSTAGLRLTLAGHPLPSNLPQTLTMRDIAINLAVFNDEGLIGKVTWAPQ